MSQIGMLLLGAGVILKRKIKIDATWNKVVNNPSIS